MDKFRKTVLVSVVAGTLLLLATSGIVFSHCEIPCGIYDDPMRLDMMAEHIATIEKSMKQIHELSAQQDKNYNQLTRWVMNKENHADHLSDIITQYFMKQRIKPVEESAGPQYRDYVHKLVLLHKMMSASMRCKQTTDLENVATLRTLLSQFRTAYLGANPGHEHK